MRNIPIFTTEYGVASLILKEIPYKGIAYIQIQDASEPLRFLQECCDFCKAAGAHRIYASGHSCLQKYPCYTEIWEMQCGADDLPYTDAVLKPITEGTLKIWREIHNARMSSVPNAATMTNKEAQKHMASGDGYFVFRGDMLLGIGIAAGGRIDSVISLCPGAGKDVLLALCQSQCSSQISLEVASMNQRAVSLYQRLGFAIAEKRECWYQVFPERDKNNTVK